MTWRVFVRLICVAWMAVYGAFPALSQDQLTPDQMKDDLVVLQKEWAERDGSFDDAERLEFRRLFDETVNSTQQLSPDAFALAIMRATATPRNGHTNANVISFLGDDLPVRAWAFSDGLYIVKAHPDFARLLGARIDKIGKLTTAEAQERVKPYLAGTDQRIRFLAPGYLVNPLVLKQIGAVEDASQVQLELTLATGGSETVQLTTANGSDPGDERLANMNRGYSVLIPDPQELAGRWPHILDKVTDRSPLYSARSDVKSSFLDPGKQALYIRIDTVNSVDETPFQDKLGGVFVRDLMPAKPHDVVVDLRLNNGGDLFNTILFAEGLPRLIPADGWVFVLVGRATFSAGISTAAMLKDRGGDKVVLVGETMGDSGQFWGETVKVTLPNSGIVVRYGAQFHDYENGCTDTSTCYWPIVAFGPRGVSLAPEIPVEVSFADYAAGRDPVLQAALDKIGKR